MKDKINFAPLYWLAVGTFAVGTEGFMIAALLPKIAKNLSVSVQAAGQLVTLFALTYAVSSPVLTALTGRFDRRQLLIVSMAIFGGANLVAALATDYWSLAGARILLAISAGLYVPGANAFAGVLVPAEWRGRALAIINGGISVAVALGVPLGAFIGNQFGWRMTFVGVALLAVIALMGLLWGLPKGIGTGLTVASLRERLGVVRQPAALIALLVTTLWAIGAYTVYTYIAPLMMTVAGVPETRIGYVLFLWGGAALLGLIVGGRANDKFGSRRVIGIALPTTMIALASFSMWAKYLTVGEALLPALTAVAVWGFAHWGFFPAQQARLIGIVGVKNASLILSLNASFMYLGFSLGAALGSFVLVTGSVADLGWMAGLCVLASLTLFIVSRPPRAA